MFSFINNIWIALIGIVFGSWLVSKAADKLGDVLHVLGVKLRVPTSVRGATFDAISSSFPELSTAMIAVIVYKQFTDVGIPTIAGSGIFNILLIPMASILAFKGAELHVTVDRKVIYRDMFFYTLSIFLLALFTYRGSYTPFSGLVLVVVYVAYIIVLYRQTKAYRSTLTNREEATEKHELEEFLEDEEEQDVEVDMGYGAIVLWVAIAIGAIWVSIDGIIQSASVVSTVLGIPQYIVSVVVIAACTSIPDTLLSVKSARMGDAEGAVANAVGSNIFDVCICLGLPMLLAGQTLEANFEQNVGVLGFVMLSMFTTAMLLLKKDGVSKKDAFVMLAVYIIFVIYIILVALGIL